jgi:hypothetical protein
MTEGLGTPEGSGTVAEATDGVGVKPAGTLALIGSGLSASAGMARPVEAECG